MTMSEETPRKKIDTIAKLRIKTPSPQEKITNKRKSLSLREIQSAKSKSPKALEYLTTTRNSHRKSSEKASNTTSKPENENKKQKSSLPKSPAQRLWECNPCRRPFALKRDLEIHMQKKHVVKKSSSRFPRGK